MEAVTDFSLDDLLDLSNVCDGIISDDFFVSSSPTADISTDSSATAVDSCHSSVSPLPNTSFSGVLPVPYDDTAELEWLANFVEESFFGSDDDLHRLQLIADSGIRPEPDPLSTQLNPGPKISRKRARSPDADVEVRRRRCLHCDSEKTPQWRSGPMGPNTLCNACGVRYMSGRLVPEYRPALSPTFVPTRHSNSHRKVIELRREKEFDSSDDC